MVFTNTLYLNKNIFNTDGSKILYIQNLLIGPKTLVMQIVTIKLH